MGVYTTIIDAAGRGIQIKTGDDCCQEYWHDEEIPKKDGVWDGRIDGNHYEGDKEHRFQHTVYTGVKGRCFIVIKNRRVVEIVDEIDNTPEAIAGFLLEQQARRQIEKGPYLPLDQFVSTYGPLPDVEEFAMRAYLVEKHGVESRW